MRASVSASPRLAPPPAVSDAAPPLIAAPPLVLTRVETPIGDMVAVTDEAALHLLEFHDRTALPTEMRRIEQRCGAVVDGVTPASDALVQELSEYFAGTRTSFGARIVQRGSPFTTRVWSALREIPCGETCSYGQIAGRIGQPSAVRAVARANGANQVAILVPCHRVIGADGTLVGYGGKLWRKKWLLDHEQRLRRLF
jgi:AraC family transcriptional regulator, regulatory protein of adaptative response / methylated-DNA-[protein]-cysteine methyltransferase